MDVNPNLLLAIRIGVGALMLITALEAWRMTAILQNDRLFILGKRIFYALLVFGLLRIIATICDGWIGWSFAWLSTVTVYAFWIATYAFFMTHRRILQKDVTAEELEQIRQGLDVALDGMKLVKRKWDESINISQSPNAK
jgi:hypothetical protein